MDVQKTHQHPEKNRKKKGVTQRRGRKSNPGDENGEGTTCLFQKKHSSNIDRETSESRGKKIELEGLGHANKKNARGKDGRPRRSKGTAANKKAQKGDRTGALKHSGERSGFPKRQGGGQTITRGKRSKRWGGERTANDKEEVVSCNKIKRGEGPSKTKKKKNTSRSHSSGNGIRHVPKIKKPFEKKGRKAR